MADLPPPVPPADRPGAPPIEPPSTWQQPGASPPPPPQWGPPGSAPLPGYPGGPQPYGGAAPQKTNVLAIVSLVLAIACGGLSAPLAIPLGIVALKQIKDSGGTQTGRPLAIAGIAVSAVFAVVALVAIGAVALLGENTEDRFVPVCEDFGSDVDGDGITDCNDLTFDPPTTFSIPG